MDGLRAHGYLEFPLVEGGRWGPVEVLREATTLQVGRVEAKGVLNHLRGVCEGRVGKKKRLEVEVGGTRLEVGPFSVQVLTYGVS